MKVFQNESECLILGGLTFENRVDRVSLFGSVDFTRDVVGLELARSLKAIVDGVVTVLEADPDLPAEVEVEKPVEVQGPFKPEYYRY